MLTLLGKIDEYNGSKEEWHQYIEGLNNFFVANGITDADKKKSVFLAGVSPATYALSRNPVAPEKWGDKSYDDLVALLMTHSIQLFPRLFNNLNFIAASGSQERQCNVCFRVMFPGEVLQFRCNARGYVEG